MAECHPVGFQWVMEAKARGATVIHVDPRFTRTSAVADLHVPIRAGTDIAFLGGLINYVLQQREVLPRLRARLHQRGDDLTEDFATPRTSTGCSPASTASTGYYDIDTWRYEGVEVQAAAGERDQRPTRTSAHPSAVSAGRPRRDARLRRRRRRTATPRHATRRCSTRAACSRCSSGTSPATRPEMVEEVCGVPQDQFAEVCAARHRELRPGPDDRVRVQPWAGPSTPSACSTSAPPRSCSCCSATWAGPAAASWRCAATPASRAPPTSRPCSTCCPATCRCRTRTGTTTSTTTSQAEAGAERVLGQHARLHGQPAEGVVGRRGHGRQRLLLRLPAAADRQPQHLRDRAWPRSTAPARATSCSARTRRSARPTPGCSGWAWPTWTGWWSATSSLIESATFWKDGPEIETGEMRTEDIGTEVFFLPAAAHIEKDGSFTNTQRMLQWHHKAVEPRGDARSDLWFTYHLAGGSGRSWPAPTDDARPAAARPHLGLPGRGAARRAGRRRGAGRDQRLGRRAASRCRRYTQLKRRRLDRRAAAGSTAACYADGVNQAARRKPRPRAELGRARVGLGLARQPADALQPGLGRPRRQAVERAQGTSLVGRGAGAVDRARRAGLHRRPSRRPTGRPRAPRGLDGDLRHRPVHHAGRRQGLAVRARPACVDGPLPTHYEPQESPFANPLYAPAAQPGRADHPRIRKTATSPSGDAAGRRRVPVRDHHLPADRAPHGRRDVPRGCPTWPSCSPQFFCRGVAGAGRRARPGAHRLGHDHHRAQRHRGPGAGHRADDAAAGRRAGSCTRSGCRGTGAERVHAPATPPTSCSDLSLDPNVHIQEVKALACDIRPGRRPRGPALRRARRGTTRSGPASPTRPGRRCDDEPTNAGRTVTADRDPAGRCRVRGSPGADGLLHRHLGLHRLQGLRGGLQGVERGARGRAAAARHVLRQHRQGLGAYTWRHVAFIEQPRSRRSAPATPAPCDDDDSAG